MEMRVTAEQLRAILAVARKLRLCAEVDEDEEYADLFLRAALALEDRARQLAFQPFDPELVPELPVMPQHVDIVC